MKVLFQLKKIMKHIIKLSNHHKFSERFWEPQCGGAVRGAATTAPPPHLILPLHPFSTVPLLLPAPPAFIYLFLFNVEQKERLWTLNAVEQLLWGIYIYLHFFCLCRSCRFYECFSAYWIFICIENKLKSFLCMWTGDLAWVYSMLMWNLMGTCLHSQWTIIFVENLS